MLNFKSAKKKPIAHANGLSIYRFFRDLRAPAEIRPNDFGFGRNGVPILPGDQEGTTAGDVLFGFEHLDWRLRLSALTTMPSLHADHNRS